MTEKLSAQIREVDKLDKKENQKVEVVPGKVDELTLIYNKKPKEVLEKLKDLPLQDRLPIETALFDVFKGINEKSILAQKDRFLQEVDKSMERIAKAKEVREVFAQNIANEILAPLGIGIQTEPLISAYLRRPENQKTPLETILANFRILQTFANNVQSSPEVVAEYQLQLSLSLIFFVNGNQKRAETILGLVVKDLEIRAEAKETVGKLEQEREKLLPLEKAHTQAAEAYLEATKRFKNSPKDQVDVIEKYSTSFKDLIHGMEPMVAINDAFTAKEPAFSKERAAILKEVAGDNLKLGISVIASSVDGNDLVLVGQKIVVPTSKAQLDEMKENADNALLFARRDLYLKTSLPQYKAAYDESQQKITAKAEKDSKEALDAAGKEDQEAIGGDFTKLNEYRTLKSEVDTNIKFVVQEFDRIQRLQISHPTEAAAALINFRTKLDSNAAILEKFKPFFAKEHSGTEIVMTAQSEYKGLQQIFFDVGKHPALRNTLSAIFETYLEQADNLAIEIATNNPMFLQFQDDFSKFFQSKGEPFRGSLVTLFQQIEEANKLDSDDDFHNDSEDSGNPGTPTEYLVEKWIHAPASELIFQKDTFHALHQQVYMLERRLQPLYHGYLEGKRFHSSIGKAGHEAFLKMHQKLEDAKKYLQELEKVCKIALELKGTRTGKLSFAIDSLKVGGKLLVAVAGAVAASFALVASAGTMTPAVGFVATTLASSFGATVGSGLAEGALEGNWSTFEGENFLKSWGTGAIFCGSGRLIGNAFGFIGGKAAAGITKLSPRLSASAQRSLQRHAEHLLEKAAAKLGGGPFSHFINEIRTETGEEMLEDSIQKIGEGLAPKYPKLGFVLSCIPAGTRMGRMKFIQETGGFSPAKGITGIVTPTGIHMEYNDLAGMRSFLESRKAPPEVMQMFTQTGKVSANFNGITIVITKTNEPGDIRSILNGPRGMKLREKSGLIFDEQSGKYFYRNSPKNIVEKILEESGLLVEINEEGTITATDGEGNTFQFFKIPEARPKAAPIAAVASPQAQIPDTTPSPVGTNSLKKQKDYSNKETREKALAELKSQKESGTVTEEDYRKQKYEILRRAHMDLMEHIVNEGEKWVIANPKATPEEIMAHLRQFADDKGLAQSRVQKAMIWRAVYAFKEDCEIISGITTGLKNPDAKKARAAKIKLLEEIGVVNPDPDRFEIRTDHPDTIVLVINDQAEYENLYRNGLILSKTDEGRMKGSGGFYAARPYPKNPNLGKKVVFINGLKEGPGFVKHEIQHRRFHAYFDYHLYKNEKERSSAIYEILTSQDSWEDKVIKLERMALMEFDPTMSPEDKIQHVKDKYTLEKAKNHLKDETIAYLKGGQYRFEEIALMGKQIREMEIHNLQYRAELRLCYENLSFELNRIQQLGVKPEEVAQVVQTSETFSDMLTRLKEIGTHEHTDKQVASMLKDLTPDETAIYRNFISFNKEAGFSPSTDQRITFIDKILQDRYFKKKYLKFKPEFQKMFPDFNCSELEQANIHPESGDFMTWNDRFQTLCNFKDSFDEAMRYAEKKPMEFLENSAQYENQPYYSKMIEKAFKKIIDLDVTQVGYVLRKLSLQRGQPFYSSIKELAEYIKTIKTDTGSRMQIYDVYGYSAHASEILEKAVRELLETKPADIFKLFPIFRNEPYAEEVLQKAAEKNPAAAIKLAEFYEGPPYSADVFAKARELDPTTAAKEAPKKQAQNPEPAPSIMAAMDGSKIPDQPASGTAIIDLISSHAKILSQLGLRRDGHLYRGVKDFAAVKDLLETGKMSNKDGSPTFMAPDAYPKYTFRAGEGYIFEVDSSPDRFEPPSNIGVDPAYKNTYKKAKDNIPISEVTRVIKVTKKSGRGSQTEVEYEIIYDRDRNINKTGVESKAPQAQAATEQIPWNSAADKVKNYEGPSFDTESSETMGIIEFLQKLKAGNGRYLGNVVHQGVRDHWGMAEHRGNLGEHDSELEKVLDSGSLLSSIGKDLLNPDFFDRAAKRIEEIMKEDGLELEQAVDSYLHETYSAAHMGHQQVTDKLAVHFSSNHILNSYYGGEGGNEAFLILPESLLLRDRDFWSRGSNSDLDAAQNDVYVWPQGEKPAAVPLEQALIFAPRDVDVDPKTGSQYEISEGKAVIDIDKIEKFGARSADIIKIEDTLRSKYGTNLSLIFKNGIENMKDGEEKQLVQQLATILTEVGIDPLKFASTLPQNLITPDLAQERSAILNNLTGEQRSEVEKLLQLVTLNDRYGEISLPIDCLLKPESVKPDWIVRGETALKNAGLNVDILKAAFSDPSLKAQAIQFFERFAGAYKNMAEEGNGMAYKKAPETIKSKEYYDRLIRGKLQDVKVTEIKGENQDIVEYRGIDKEGRERVFKVVFYTGSDPNKAVTTMYQDLGIKFDKAVVNEEGRPNGRSFDEVEYRHDYNQLRTRLVDKMKPQSEPTTEVAKELDQKSQEKLVESILTDTYSDIERHGGFLSISVTPNINGRLALPERKISFKIPWDGKKPAAEVAKEFLAKQDWSSNSDEYWHSVDWQTAKTPKELVDSFVIQKGPQMEVAEIVPELNTPFLAKHLLPHFLQGAKRSGLTLEQYAEKIHQDPVFREKQQEWLKDPYLKVYKLKEGIKSEGINDGNPLLSLAANEKAMNAAEGPLKNLIQEKIKNGDYHIRFANCGCGLGGTETYAYTIYLNNLLENVARENGIKEEDIDAWMQKWDIKVVGYSIMPSHLAQAEEADGWKLNSNVQEKAGETEYKKSFERFLQSTAHSEVDGEKHQYNLKGKIRNQIKFEWIDLTDPVQLERIGKDVDLLVMRRTFYVYQAQWAKGPIKTAIDSMVGSLREGGVFITDSDVQNAGAKAQANEKLYFTHPSLTDVKSDTPLKMGDKAFLTTDDFKKIELELQALRTELDDLRTRISKADEEVAEELRTEFKQKNKQRIYLQDLLHAGNERLKRYEAFIPEIDAHNGLSPTGAYVKIPTLTKLDSRLSSPDFKPHELITFLEANFPIGAEYQRNAGVWEGYSLGQHTIMMMNQFEKYGLAKELGPMMQNPEFLPFFRLFLSMHDIGKPRAVAAGNKDDQHIHTVEIMGEVLPQLGVKPEMVKLAQALIMDDPLGKMLQRKISEKEAVEIIMNMVKTSGLSAEQFFPILKVFYKTDTAAYTVDAGGVASLDKLFQFEPGKLKFKPSYEDQIYSIHMGVIRAERNLHDQATQQERSNRRVLEQRALVAQHLPLLQKHADYVLGDLYTNADSYRTWTPAEKEIFELYLVGRTTEEELMANLDLNKIFVAVAGIAPDIILRIEETQEDLAEFKEHFSKNPKDLAEFESLFPSEQDAAMRSYFKGELTEEAVLDKIGLTKSHLIEHEGDISRFNAREKIRIFLQLQKQIKSIESSSMSPKEKLEQLAIIAESKSILTDGDFASDIHHGTNSLAWRGIKESGGNILSSAELQRQSIAIETGERDIAGGSTAADGIYVGQGVDGYGTAQGYAYVNAYTEGYRNPLAYTLQELNGYIATYRSAIDKLKKQGLDGIPKISSGGNLETLQRELAGFEEALKMRETVDIYSNAKKTYPIVFGFKQEGLKLVHTPEQRNFGGFLSGEMKVSEPAISLLSKCDKMFVQEESIEDARKSLIEAIGKEAADKIKIYSFEAMTNVETLRKGTVASSSFNSTFENLSEMQRNRMRNIYNFANTP